jgi:hypothetical protein
VNSQKHATSQEHSQPAKECPELSREAMAAVTEPPVDQLQHFLQHTPSTTHATAPLPHPASAN